jgi:hypothetical protein
MQSLKVLLSSRATVTSVLLSFAAVTALRHVITESFPTLVNKDQNKRKAVRNSMRLDCPWILRAKPDLPYWVVFEIVDTHNHTIARNPLVYHQYRKLNDDDQQKLHEYMAAKARNIVIYEALRKENNAPKLSMKVSE